MERQKTTTLDKIFLEVENEAMKRELTRQRVEALIAAQVDAELKRIAPREAR